jgi:hypothetical protein
MACPWMRVCRVGRVYTLQSWLLIQISTTFSDMSDSLFTVPTHRNACLLL